MNTWLTSTKNGGRSSNSSRANLVLSRCLRRIGPAVLRRYVPSHESFDVVDTYELQTKHGILQSKYWVQNLNHIDQCTTEVDSRELGNSRCKITLRYAAKASYTGSRKRRRIYCGCAGDCRLARCVCYKNGIGCTIYCHRHSGECPNKATGSGY